MHTAPDQTVALPGLGDEVYIADLRDVASHWHGGQWSALYAFASSGTIVAGLAREANECAEHAQSSPDDGADFPDDVMLRAIAELEKTLDTAPE